MEGVQQKEGHEKPVIARPVATRPSCAGFRSFSELLAGAINASPSRSPLPTNQTPTTVAIRPKTVRLKPSGNHLPVAGTHSHSSQAVAGSVSASGGGGGVADEKVEERSNVIYKPLAKVVSRTTASLLANMGNLDSIQRPPAPLMTSKPAQSQPERTQDRIPSTSRPAAQSLDQTQTAAASVVNGDRPSFDGYNWRKYGQKQVKGSEYPRSYYKCTHPNCPVKKKVERSLDGQIAEIVYKGEHNHPKLQPPKRVASEGQGQPLEKTGQDASNVKVNDPHKSEGTHGGKVDRHNEINQKSTIGSSHRKISQRRDLANAAVPSGRPNVENCCGDSEESEERLGGDEENDEVPVSKRRRKEKKLSEVGLSTPDPQVVLQANTDSEILEDGFRWRKYGQKMVKGNPYPRSYYRCTSLRCNVRKHVERSSDDPGSFITTYEGKHNHEIPASKNGIAEMSDGDVPAPGEPKH